MDISEEFDSVYVHPQYVLNIGFWRSPTIVFEVGFVKSDSKIVSWYQLALLAATANAKTFRAEK